MESFLNQIGFYNYNNIYASVIVFICSMLFYFVVKKSINKIIPKKGSEIRIDKKLNTRIKLINNVLKYLFIILVAIVILRINGVNVTSLAAGVGVASIIIGLALQEALKDIIMGINIIVDDYFNVGDVIKIGDHEGKVLEIGLKATKIKNVNNDEIYVVANRNIGDAVTISNQFDIRIPLHYEDSINKIEEILNQIAMQISKQKNVIKCEYRGIDEFGDSAIFYAIKVWALPENKGTVKREANRTIKIMLDENNIEVPYNQLDVHNK